ncbi:MAG: hypothetical protein U1F23_07975 [Lysobacterales bacterium]
MIVIVFFSIPRGKRNVYLMPAIPMAALAYGPSLADMIRSRWLRLEHLLDRHQRRRDLRRRPVGYPGHSAIAQALAERRGLEGSGSPFSGSSSFANGRALLAVSAAFRPRRTCALLGGLVALWLLWSF